MHCCRGYHDALGLRKWTIAPKLAGACATAKLWDLEVCNEARKVLARMFNKLVNEVCTHAIHSSQQALLSGRDIIVNNVRMHSIFRDWVRKGQEGNGDAVLLLLLLDCSKGYNHLAWSWVVRCLQAARLPLSLRTAAMSMLQGEVRLMLGGQEKGGLRYQAGFPQGCPPQLFSVHDLH